ncbi:MAG: hypothetical protein ACI37S_05560 [Candidatus Gastranaerophilaceae bacterium]
MEEKKSQQRRWYDKDPALKEALELLRLAPGDKKDAAADFVIQLQEQIAGDVIEKIYDIMCEYHGKGRRWYDNDPIVMKAIQLLRVAPKHTQKEAALKLLTALENNEGGGMELLKD